MGWTKIGLVISTFGDPCIFKHIAGSEKNGPETYIPWQTEKMVKRRQNGGPGVDSRDFFQERSGKNCQILRHVEPNNGKSGQISHFVIFLAKASKNGIFWLLHLAQRGSQKYHLSGDFLQDF